MITLQAIDRERENAKEAKAHAWRAIVAALDAVPHRIELIATFEAYERELEILNKMTLELIATGKITAKPKE